jgi:hypothetical protein
MPANSPQGWQAPTLRREAGQWRIYCDSGAAFVLLDKATDELVAACPGRGKGGSNTIMNLFKQQKNKAI